MTMKAASLKPGSHIMMEPCSVLGPPPQPNGNAVRTNNSCTYCYSRLLELKKQVMKYMMVEYHKIIVGAAVPSLENLLLVVYQNLKLTEQHLAGLLNKTCTYCGVNVDVLKKHALLALQTANFAPLVTQGIMTMNQNDQILSDASLTSRPTASQGETSDSLNGRRVQGLNNTSDHGRDAMNMAKNNFARAPQQTPNGGGAVPSPTPAQFFAEAAKKFNIPNKRKSKKSNKNRIDDNRLFPTDFSSLIKMSPPANPPGLFKYMGRRVDGKVSVMLKIAPSKEMEYSDSLIEVDQRKKQISVQQPKNTNFIPPKLQLANAVPKLFGFDAIFEPEMLPSQISSSSLLDVLHSVINGGEGCLLVYGASGLGKSSTMVGRDESNRTLGFIPAAIAWLYSLIEDCKQRTGARISVRVSAVEVIGQTEQLKDLLSEQAHGGDSADSTGTSPGIYLREDPIRGTVQLGNVSEPQAVTAEKAAFYLDAALASRTDGEQNSHMIFTVHVYQYRVEKNQRRGPGGAVPYSGGRSRLHLIDLSCFNSNFDQMQNGMAPSHAGLGQIIVAMLNGFKQVPYKDSKITRLLKDSIGNPTCRTTLVAHVSSEERQYAKTFSTLQVVSKIQRSRRKRNKYCSSSSDNTSCDESRRRRPYPAIVKTYGIDDSNMSSDYNTSSAGEESCDTVIYMGNNGHMSDRDLSDNERPPSPKTFRAMQLKLTSSSEDETSEPPNKLSTSELKMDANTNCIRDAFDKHKTDGSSNNTQSFVNTSCSSINSNNNCNNNGTTSIPSLRPSDTTNREKVVNIVPPLIIHEKPRSPRSNIKRTTPLSSPTDVETAEVCSAKQNEETNKDNNDVVDTGGNEAEQDKAPSEKELRRREKRIAKLLKDTMTSDDVPALVSLNNRKNMSKTSCGYTSDNSGGISRMYNKQDGYISAPENNRCKPIQVVKGTVRQTSVDSPSADQNLKKADLNNNTDLLRNWVQNELLKHLREMETMKSNLDIMSNAVVPESTTKKGKDVSEPFEKDQNSNHIIESSVDCVGDTKAVDTTATRGCNFEKPLVGEGTPLDDTEVSITKDSASMNATNSDDVLIPPLDNIGTSVDPPSVESAFITNNSSDDNVEEVHRDLSKELVHTEVCSEDRQVCKKTTTFGVEPCVNTSYESGTHVNNCEKDIPVGNTNCTTEKGVTTPKIQNLNHVITVSAIPNFAVAAKEPLLNRLVSSPQVQRNATRTASIANTRYYKGSSTSVDQDWQNRPVFERSYSREDTCSLVSANESFIDPYDSDTYCSSFTSYTPSPAVERKPQHRPTRLKYRWSTVFEEEENKKEKTLKNANSGKHKTEHVSDSSTRNVTCDTPKSSRFSKSPKKEKDRRNTTQPVGTSPQTPKTTPQSLSSPTSPKSHKKFQLLSPRSDRRMKETSTTDNKRNSGCSDASSGIGSSSSHSQSSSLHSNEDILTDEVIVIEESPPKSKYWPFSRSKSRRPRSSPSGYMSDGNIQISSSRRHSRIFRSRSKSMVYNDGQSSGYDTSITEGGMTSCNEDTMTDTEGGRTKKKKRFLGFRRRSTNDLNSSRGRYKKPIWFDNRRCQSDDEDVRIKVYNIDGPPQLDRQICKSENSVSPRFQLKRIEELKKERGHSKSFPDPRFRSATKLEEQFGIPLEKENSAIGRKLRTLKNHIQVVTCFDPQTTTLERKVTRI